MYIGYHSKGKTVISENLANFLFSEILGKNKQINKEINEYNVKT